MAAHEGKFFLVMRASIEMSIRSRLKEHVNTRYYINGAWPLATDIYCTSERLQGRYRKAGTVERSEELEEFRVGESSKE